ncbi:MAG TPA: DedA family protein [Solirubrobacteraceae bacterium]|nr:DedA family protein [Solirubrobacteraceae bacterium]
MLAIGAIISVSSGLGYLLPAIIGLESMGIPSPGETALVLAAVLASQGNLQIWLVIVIASASAIVGDNIGYLLGRKLGRRVLTAPGPLHHRRLRVIEAGSRFFEKHGPKAVFLGRWIALVRFAIAWLAGIEHMRFRTFFVYNALGGITWATAYGLVGYYLGKAAADAITHYGIYAAVVIAVLAVAWIGFALWRERRAGAGAETSSAPEEPPVLGGGADAAAGGDAPLGPADDQA